VFEIVSPEDSAIPDPHESRHLPDMTLNQARPVSPRESLHTPAPDLGTVDLGKGSLWNTETLIETEWSVSDGACG